MADRVTANLQTVEKRVDTILEIQKKKNLSYEDKIDFVKSELKAKASIDSMKEAIKSIRQDFAEIDDENISEDTTYSSKKIVETVEERVSKIKIPSSRG
jgi:hypothetical protein